MNGRDGSEGEEWSWVVSADVWTERASARETRGYRKDGKSE